MIILFVLALVYDDLMSHMDPLFRHRVMYPHDQERGTQSGSLVCLTSHITTGRERRDGFIAVVCDE